MNDTASEVNWTTSWANNESSFTRHDLLADKVGKVNTSQNQFSNIW